MQRPTLHVTNAASRSLHGPGRLFHIMVWPPKWLEDDGTVEVLRPHPNQIQAYKNGIIGIDQYRQEYLKRLAALTPYDLSPGWLMAFNPAAIAFDEPNGRMWVTDGDTLVCTCSREVARESRCHRVWAARALAEQGWHVILDGQKVDLRQPVEPH